ncbi:MAG: V-type ATP synthase subunit F [Christensenellales bacterium]|jgi:V/A-type H+-transporting ATPase subunit F|nr:V-type ATP synthase subunit F [Clostridiales bacterium]
MSKKSSKIGVIGSSDAVLAFRTLGMVVRPVRSPQQAMLAVHRLVQEGVPLIFVTEDIAKDLSETFAQYASDPTVTLIPLPGVHGSDGLGMQRVRKNVEKAVGADILFNDTED